MREHVLTPLSLNDTFYSIPQTAMARYAQGQTRDGRSARIAQAVLATEAYGLRITASDLLRWVEAQLGLVPAPGGLVQALRTTQAGQLRVGPMTQGAIWEWYVPPLSERDVLEGNGDAMVFKPNRGMPLDGIPPPAGALVNKTGGTNGFSAYAAFIAEREIGLVILANRKPSRPASAGAGKAPARSGGSMMRHPSWVIAVGSFMLAATLPVGVSHGQKGHATGKPWREIKCERYRQAWSQALTHFGRDGLSAEFIARHEAFLASGCDTPRDVCPRSEREFFFANTMTILAMNAGTASTFPPFACRTSR